MPVLVGRPAVGLQRGGIPLEGADLGPVTGDVLDCSELGEEQILARPVVLVDAGGIVLIVQHGFQEYAAAGLDAVEELRVFNRGLVGVRKENVEEDGALAVGLVLDSAKAVEKVGVEVPGERPLAQPGDGFVVDARRS